MRAAAFVAAGVVAIGIYLAIAATFSFTASLIGLGVLGIAVVAAIAMMVGGSATSAEQPA